MSDIKTGYYPKNAVVPDGYWMGRWKVDGKRIMKVVPKKIQDGAEALAWLMRERNQTAPVSKTLAGLIPVWLKLKDDVAFDLATFKQFRSNCKVWLLESGEKHQRIDHLLIETELTGEVIADWIKSIDKAPYTVRNIVFTLRSLLNDCMDKKWVNLSINPCDARVVKKSVPEGKTLVRVALGRGEKLVLNREAVDGLLNGSVSEWRHCKYLVALFTGMRDGEIMGLQWGDLVRVDGVVCFRLRRQISRYQSWKGGMKTKLPKKDSTRTIPLTDRLLVGVEKWREEWIKKWGVIVDGSFIFPHPHMSKAVAYLGRSAEDLREDLKRVGVSDQLAGIDFDFHSLRRTMITAWTASGGHHDCIKQVIGHAADNVTAANYAVWGVSAIKAELEKLPW